MAKAMARHILVKTMDEAQAIKERIAKGEPFDKLARKYSPLTRSPRWRVKPS